MAVAPAMLGPALSLKLLWLLGLTLMGQFLCDLAGSHLVGRGLVSVSFRSSLQLVRLVAQQANRSLAAIAGVTDRQLEGRPTSRAGRTPSNRTTGGGSRTASIGTRIDSSSRRGSRICFRLLGAAHAAGVGEKRQTVR